MTEDYVSFETAKLLKKLGFNEECVGAYSETNHTIAKFESNVKNSEVGPLMYSTPTLQMVMNWLREVHHIHIGINPISGKGYNATIYDVADFDDYGIIFDTESFFHVEEACEAAIKYCLENLI